MHITLRPTEFPIRFLNIAGLPSINLPIRVLIRTSLAQLHKRDYSFEMADMELIKKLCDRLSFTEETKIRHLITRILDDKEWDDKSERVDIIFEYGSPTIEINLGL